MFYKGPGLRPEPMPHILQATGSVGTARPLRFTECRLAVQGREPMIHGLAVVRVAATSCVLQGVGAGRGADTPFFYRAWTARGRAGLCVLRDGGAWSKAGLPRFMGQRWLGLRRDPIFCRVARVCTWRIRVRIRAGTPFFTGRRCTKSTFPKWLRMRIRARTPFFAGNGRPCAHCSNRIHAGSTTPATFLGSDPCGSMWRIHVDFPFFTGRKRLRDCTY